MARRTRDQNRHADGRYAPDSSGKAGIPAPAAAPGAWDRFQRAVRGWCEIHQSYHVSDSSIIGCLECWNEDVEKLIARDAEEARARQAAEDARLAEQVRAAVADALPAALTEHLARAGTPASDPQPVITYGWLNREGSEVDGFATLDAAQRFTAGQARKGYPGHVVRYRDGVLDDLWDAPDPDAAG